MMEADCNCFKTDKVIEALKIYFKAQKSNLET